MKGSSILERAFKFYGYIVQNYCKSVIYGWNRCFGNIPDKACFKEKAWN